MAVYFISYVYVQKQTPEYAEYVRLVKPMIEKHGGEYLIRAKEFDYLGDGPKPDKVMAIRFPSRANLDAWINGEEYQSIVSARLDATKTQIVIVEGD